MAPDPMGFSAGRGFESQLWHMRYVPKYGFCYVQPSKQTDQILACIKTIYGISWRSLAKNPDLEFSVHKQTFIKSTHIQTRFSTIQKNNVLLRSEYYTANQKHMVTPPTTNATRMPQPQHHPLQYRTRLPMRQTCPRHAQTNISRPTKSLWDRSANSFPDNARIHLGGGPQSFQ